MNGASPFLLLAEHGTGFLFARVLEAFHLRGVLSQRVPKGAHTSSTRIGAMHGISFASSSRQKSRTQGRSGEVRFASAVNGGRGVKVASARQRQVDENAQLLRSTWAHWQVPDHSFS